ncbi:MAG: Kelch repeat-containing protein [Elainellaceae cyanobacterium]
MVKLSSLFSIGIALLATLAAPACTLRDADSQNAPQQTAQNQQESQWEEAGELPLSLESHQMLALGDYVYLLGGWNETAGPYDDVFFTPLSPDGSLDDWQETTAALPLRLQHHAAIAHGGALYVLGGDNGFWDESTVSDRIFRAMPDATGDITTWEDVGQLPAPLTIHAVTMVDDQVYVMGGSNTFRPGTTLVDTVFTAQIASDGTFGAFETLAPFPTPIGWMTATAVGRHIIAISGKTQFSPTQLTETVWRAAVGEDAQLSPFEAVSTTVPRERHATVRVNQTLVAIAGGGTDGVLSRVDAATIDPQGNLEWKALSPLPEPRYAHAAFAHEGFIYVSGGFLRYGSNETSRKVFRLPFSSVD